MLALNFSNTSKCSFIAPLAATTKKKDVDYGNFKKINIGFIPF